MANSNLITEEMPVIQDVLDFEYELSEDVNNDQSKSFKLKGVFQQSDVQNGNGRLYPRVVLEREVARLQPMITEKRILGELDHPADAKIHLDKVSHMLTRLDMRPTGEVYGEATVLETPSGKVLTELLRSGVKLGISSRGFGSVNRHNGVDEVSNDYKMVTFDIVSDPSTPEAFPNAVYEHKENNDDTEETVPMSLVVEDVFDELNDGINLDLSREYIGTADGTRFYIKEGAYESYGNFKNHASHYWHLELKNSEGVVKVGITEAKMNKLRETFGDDIVAKALEKIGYKGFNPQNLTKSKTTFASDEIK